MPDEFISREGAEALRLNCDDLRRFAKESYAVELAYDDQSIQRLASFIESIRDRIDEQNKKVYIEKLGSFLGEAIIARYGGEWVVTEGEV